MEIMLVIAVVLVFAAACGLMMGWMALEIQSLRRQNAELIDKFMFNKQPERIVKQNATPLTPVQTFGAGGMGDPVSIAEEKARRASIPADQVLDEG